MHALDKKQARKARRVARDKGASAEEIKAIAPAFRKARRLFTKIQGMNNAIEEGVPGVAKEKRKLSDTWTKQSVNLGDFWNPTRKNFAR